jgi:hypothetical protein
MRKFLLPGVLALAVAAVTFLMPTPAQAQTYYYTPSTVVSPYGYTYGYAPYSSYYYGYPGYSYYRYPSYYTTPSYSYFPSYSYYTAPSYSYTPAYSYYGGYYPRSYYYAWPY